MGAPFGNQYALGNGGGRPRIFDTAEDLIKRIDDYFIYVLGDWEEVEGIKKDKETGEETRYTYKKYSREPEPITITGLTLFLGFQSRSSLDDYCRTSDEYSYIIKKAKMLVEHAYEKRLHGDMPSGAIFGLKNMGWADKSEVKTDNKHEHTGNVFVFGEAKGCEPINDADGDKAD